MRARWSILAILFSTLAACAHDAPPPPSGSPLANARCPDAWTSPPQLDPKLVPSDAPRVLARVSATGTQRYICTASDAGAVPSWTFAGPDASLVGCDGSPAGRHFASDAGPTAPKWQATDGSWVVATKVVAVPAAAGSVPSLLLRVTASGGQGVLTGATYVQRTSTSGGAAPATGCDAAHASSEVAVPYTAAYWFLSP